MEKTLALFDFDGTLTSKDSLGDFILFTFGMSKTIIFMITISPILMSYALGFIDNNKAKEKLINYIFKGFTVDEMTNLGNSYARNQLPKILKKTGLDRLKWHQEKGHEVVIVSASTEYWLKPWTDEMGFELIATQLEVKDNRLTGFYFGQNCHGEEKVRRIKENYDLTQYDNIYAYGDTSGDIPMLGIANHTFYKYFKR